MSSSLPSPKPPRLKALGFRVALSRRAGFRSWVGGVQCTNCWGQAHGAAPDGYRRDPMGRVCVHLLRGACSSERCRIAHTWPRRVVAAPFLCVIRVLAARGRRRMSSAWACVRCALVRSVCCGGGLELCQGAVFRERCDVLVDHARWRASPMSAAGSISPSQRLLNEVACVLWRWR